MPISRINCATLGRDENILPAIDITGQTQGPTHEGQVAARGTEIVGTCGNHSAAESRASAVPIVTTHCQRARAEH